MRSIIHSTTLRYSAAAAELRSVVVKSYTHTHLFLYAVTVILTFFFSSFSYYLLLFLTFY